MPEHIPVLLEECLALLAPALEAAAAEGRMGVAVDATLGLGGHSEAILERFDQCLLVGLDRDPTALKLAGERLARFGPRFQPVRCVYDELPTALDGLGQRAADAILFDLGVSSMQLDEVSRGFSYSREAPLDMRMDPDSWPTAAEVVNTYSAPDLARVLREYGEEKFASRIARAIVAARAERPLTTSSQLVDLVRAAIPAAARRTGGNPAKRTFQALRIEVNSELEVLARAIPAAFARLRVGGRMVVMSYQSLEDRIVKREFTAVSQVDLPPGLPVIPKHLAPTARVLTRGSGKASEDEVQRNPRAASVRLRGVQRLR
jgi:16S rRNA (cytosine1402-N4)-methyltransferase